MVQLRGTQTEVDIQLFEWWDCRLFVTSYAKCRLDSDYLAQTFRTTFRYKNFKQKSDCVAHTKQRYLCVSERRYRGGSTL